MAFGFGVGDVVLVITSIKKAYDFVEGAPPKLNDALDEVDMIDAKLTFLENHNTNNEQAFIKRHGNAGQKLATLLHNFAIKTEFILEDLQKILVKWIEVREIPARRTWFSIRYMSKVEDLLGDLKIQDTRMANILDTLDHGSIANLDDDRIARAEEDKAATRKQKDLIAKLIREELDDKGAENVSAAATNVNAKSREQLEKALIERGLSPAQAKTAIDAIKNDINSGVTRKTTKPEMKEVGTILVVDRENGVRSIVTQGYLELVRSWTVNTTGKWLFRKVDSAGWAVETPFSRYIASLDQTKLSPVHWTKPGLPGPSDAITELAGDQKYFWSANGPQEKRTLINKLREHRSRGIVARFFWEYTYILCFDEYTHEALQILLRRAKETAKPDSSPPKAVIKRLTPDEPWTRPLPDRVAAFKKATQIFLAAEMNWERPSGNRGIADGPFRTCYLWVHPETVGKIIGKGGTKLKELSEKSGCTIRVAPYRPEDKDGGQMVSMTGPKEALNDAFNLVNAVGVVE